jgi:hypothetical protein
LVLLTNISGVLNLHGMPAVIGGAAAAVATAIFDTSYFSAEALARTYPAIPSGRTFASQASLQIAFLAITICIAIVSGSIVGAIVRYISPPKDFYVDSAYWEVPELEKPYFFDARGEIEHQGGNLEAGRSIAHLERRLKELESGVASVHNKQS